MGHVHPSSAAPSSLHVGSPLSPPCLALTQPTHSLLLQANAGLHPPCLSGTDCLARINIPAAGQCRRVSAPTSILHSGVLLEQQPFHPAPTCCRPMPAGANPYFQLTEEEAIELTKAEQEENP